MGYELIEFGAPELFPFRGPAFRFWSAFHKLFNSRPRNKCLARTHDLSYSSSPDQVHNRQPGQARFPRRLHDVNPLGRIKLFFLETNSSQPDVARSGSASRLTREAHDFRPRDVHPSFKPACGQASSIYQLPNGLPGDTPSAGGVPLGHPFVSI